MQMPSPASFLASLPEKERQRLLRKLDTETKAWLRWHWKFWARPNQYLPQGDWFVWMIIAGRGWGKTRTAVENIAEILRGPTPLSAPKGAPSLMSFIADSPFDMRQYSIEGPSGFLNVGPPEWRPLYEPSKRTLTWPNGAKALLFSAEDPEAMRGASGSFFWWDELAKSRYAREGWDNLMFGMREGNPRGIVTTTPRPIPLMRELVNHPHTHVTGGSTWDNEDNLSSRFFESVIKPRMGTRLGQQEIEGKILDDIQGALWDYDDMDMARIKPRAVPDLVRVAVGVDPSGGGDDIGIVVAGEGVDGKYYVLFDATCNLSPAGWGRRTSQMFDRFQGDIVVAERNFGGDMVESTLRAANPKLPVKMVTASRGKVVRAEPVAALYEQGRVRHAGHFDELEAQMYHMTTHGFIGEGSPDRVDALVWALTELALAPAERDRGVAGQANLR